MKKYFVIWILLLATFSISAQDEVHLVAGYSFTGKITSTTGEKVVMRRTNNKIATIKKTDIWKIVYGDGREIVLNESVEEIESRIGKIDAEETLEKIIREGSEIEAEVAYYFLIKKGYQYEAREQHLSDFSERFPNSKYQRELASMSRFSKKLNKSEVISFKCNTPFTPEAVERNTNFNLQFTDQHRVSHTLDFNVMLKFIRTYGKKTKLKPATEWKNKYEITIVLDDSPEPIEFNDTYKLAGEQGNDAHRIFLSDLAVGNLNLNGQINIGTHIRQDDGEYTIDIDMQVDYQKW